MSIHSATVEGRAEEKGSPKGEPLYLNQLAFQIAMSFQIATRFFQSPRELAGGRLTTTKASTEDRQKKQTSLELQLDWSEA
jgi:hypothetical protein